MRLSWTIISAVALGLAGTSTARPAHAADEPDGAAMLQTGLQYTVALLAGTYGGMMLENHIGRSRGLLETNDPRRAQIAALSAQDLELLRRLQPQPGEEVTQADKKFFTTCMLDAGVTTKTAIKHALPVAVYCKRKLAQKQSRDRAKQWQRLTRKATRTAARKERQAKVDARRAALDQRRDERWHNRFAKATTALEHVGRMLDSGLRRVFDPNSHPARTATAAAAGAAHGALPWQFSSQKLESVLQRARSLDAP
ncbi:MAG: hypothetical protein M1826_002117 [Phylliscum demangeonii]|nr:MAG: hypothetical protein M1826_002117 [Phylliscum demangeonii]